MFLNKIDLLIEFTKRDICFTNRLHIFMVRQKRSASQQNAIVLAYFIILNSFCILFKCNKQSSNAVKWKEKKMKMKIETNVLYLACSPILMCVLHYYVCFISLLLALFRRWLKNWSGKNLISAFKHIYTTNEYIFICMVHRHGN